MPVHNRTLNKRVISQCIFTVENRIREPFSKAVYPECDTHHQNPKWLTKFSTLLQKYLTRTNWLSKWTKQCNILKYTEKWMENNIKCNNKKSTYRYINLCYCVSVCAKAAWQSHCQSVPRQHDSLMVSLCHDCLTVSLCQGSMTVSLSVCAKTA